jgi:hypothetical protein
MSITSWYVGKLNLKELTMGRLTTNETIVVNLH